MDELPIELLPGLRCPYCSAPVEQHFSTGANASRPPVPGALMMCWTCREIAVYVYAAAGVALRVVTDEERGELERMPHVRQLRAALVGSHTPGQAVSLTRTR